MTLPEPIDSYRDHATLTIIAPPDLARATLSVSKGQLRWHLLSARATRRVSGMGNLLDGIT